MCGSSERLYHLDVEKLWDGRQRSVVDALMGGLKGDVAIAPKQRTMPRGIPRGARQQSNRSAVSSCRSTSKRESLVISAEVRCDTALLSEVYHQDTNGSQQYFQSHLHNCVFCIRTPGHIAQASSSTASYQAFLVWLHISLASPGLITHDRDHDEAFPGEAKGGRYDPRWSPRMTYKEFAETASSAQVRYHNNYVTRLIAERQAIGRQDRAYAHCLPRLSEYRCDTGEFFPGATVWRTIARSM